MRNYIVNKSIKKIFFFVNVGVYIKNRNFRMYLFSKYGKNNFFFVVVENEFVFLLSMNDEVIFMDLLIVNVK